MTLSITCRPYPHREIYEVRRSAGDVVAHWTNWVPHTQPKKTLSSIYFPLQENWFVFDRWGMPKQGGETITKSEPIDICWWRVPLPIRHVNKTAEVLSFASRLGRQRSETDYVMCPLPIWVLLIINDVLIQQWDSLRFTCHAMFTKSYRRTKKENDAGR